MITEPVKRYSQAFRQQDVREYEDGASIYSLRQKYGIGDHHTIERWVKQYGRSSYRSGVVQIQHHHVGNHFCQPRLGHTAFQDGFGFKTSLV